jgi:ABC-type Na+ efflux pump permease subunit
MLWKSRAFWTAAADLVTSLVLYFCGKYLIPSAFEDIKVVLLAVQPVIALIIAAFASEAIKQEIRQLLK